jgi:hypothetical protein
MRILLSLICYLTITTVSYAQEVDESLLIASLSRTTCYGNCPYYEIKLYSNGLAIYHGKKNVDNIGLFKATIDQQLISKILSKAKDIDYMSLGLKYPTKGLGIIDFPVCITTIKTDTEKKMIYNRNDSPQKLVEYEQFFDEILEEIEWKAI